MNVTKHFTLALLAAAGLALAAQPAAAAERYAIDKKGMHAFVQFKIKHLGYSWLVGRFNDFDGHFSFDAENPADSSVEVSIDPASVDTNHAKRDKHLRSDDFLDVDSYPEARFVSTRVVPRGDGRATVYGDFTLHGVTKEIAIDVTQIGAGEDPWGGYRRGFEGRTSFALKDFDIDYDLGPASRTVEIYLSIEGVRQQ